MAESRPVNESEMTIGEVHQRNSVRHLQYFNRLTARYTSLKRQRSMLGMRDRHMLPGLDSRIFTCDELYREVLRLQLEATKQHESRDLMKYMHRLNEQITCTKGALIKALVSQQSNVDGGHEPPTVDNHLTNITCEELDASMQKNEHLMDMTWELPGVTLQNLEMIPCQCDDKQLLDLSSESRTVCHPEQKVDKHNSQLTDKADSETEDKVHKHETQGNELRQLYQVERQESRSHTQSLERATELQNKCARIGELERTVQSYHTQLVDKLRAHGIATDKLKDEIKSHKQIIQQLNQQLAKWDTQCKRYRKELEKEQHLNYQQRRRHDKTIQERQQDQEAFQVERQSLKEDLAVEKKRVKCSVVHLCNIGKEKKLLQAALNGSIMSNDKVEQIDCEKRKLEERLSSIDQHLQECIIVFDQVFDQSNNKSQILKIMQQIRKDINFGVQVTPVDPRKRQQLLEKMQGPNSTLYPMLSSHKGKCYIINIVNYTKENILRRRGSEEDEWRLKALFTQIGFLVESYRDLEHEELVSVLERAQQESGDSFVLALLTHGTNGTVVAADSGKLHIELDIKTRIRRVLPGKPKLFIIVACQKDGESLEDEGQRFPSTRLQTEPDFVETVHLLTVYSTVYGCPSYRHIERGTPFIQKLVDIFQEHCHDTEVGHLIRMVRGDLSDQSLEPGIGGQHECTLTKKWYLLPKDDTLATKRSSSVAPSLPREESTRLSLLLEDKTFITYRS